MKVSASILLLLSTSAITFLSSTAINVDLLSWNEAYEKADKLINEMTLDQIADITTGNGLFRGPCTGITTETTNPDFPALCLADGPLGVRGTPFASAFPAGMTIAASFDKEIMRQRGEAMGAEFRGKGAHVQLGPAMNIARVAKSGRNWEGFGEVCLLLLLLALSIVLFFSFSFLNNVSLYRIHFFQVLLQLKLSLVFKARVL